MQACNVPVPLVDVQIARILYNLHEQICCDYICHAENVDYIYSNNMDRWHTQQDYDYIQRILEQM